MTGKGAKEAIAQLVTDSALQEKLKEAKTIEEKMQVAKDAGYEFDVTEFTKVRDDLINLLQDESSVRFW